MALNTFSYCDDYIGFDNTREFLPKNFDTFNSKNKLRLLFLNLSNNILKCTCKFSKYEQQKLSQYPLKTAFIYKINSMLPNKNLKAYKIQKKFTFCINSTKVINNYLNKKTNNSFFVTNNMLLPAAKLISICFTNNNMQLLIDKHLLFHEFVLKKVKKLHKDKEVIDLGDSISIKAKNVCAVKIYTSWENVDRKSLDIKEQIQNAIKYIKTGEFNQIYLAYPKNDGFTKHIPVYVDELKNRSYQIKAIPYSLRSTLRN